MPNELELMRRRQALQRLAVLSLLAGCATPASDPVQVLVVGLDPLDGQGMEFRFLCKLRVQNPNEAPIDFSGVFVELQVNGATVASGVSDATGTVPRFGETLLEVPVTISALRVARVALGMFTSTSSGGSRAPIPYALKGKIAGPTFSAVRFESKGELDLSRFGDSVPVRTE
ncbi:LEA/WHy family protein [Ramlibacter tataouinensis]|nr:LEA type 2 family protein [Ramlibacter tataouinensis]